MAIVLFNAWDPRGCNVVLLGNRYANHIQVSHPGIEPEDILRAVESPDLITNDPEYVLDECYYLKGFKLDKDSAEALLKVVARWKSDSLTVITAYVTNWPKPTENVVWPQK